jgi:hypothetical protein
VGSTHIKYYLIKTVDNCGHPTYISYMTNTLFNIRLKRPPHLKAVLFPTLEDYIEWANGRGSGAYSVNVKPDIGGILYTVNRILPHPSTTLGDWAIAEYHTPRIHNGYTYTVWAVSMNDFEVVK